MLMRFKPCKKIALASSILIAVIFLSVFLIRYIKHANLPQFSSPNAEYGARESTSYKSAYETAIFRARKWSDDAVPSYFELKNSDASRFIFVSEKKNGIGFAVEVFGDDVTEAEEISYNGLGAIIPETIITSDEAIERVKNTAGYEDALIEDVEAVYGREGKVWYWGVKTDKGTVSVETR